MKSSSSSSSSMKLLNNLRYTSLILGISNLTVIILGLILIVFGYLKSCTRPQLVPFYLLIFASAIRIFAMIRCAIAQQAAAIAIIGSSSSSSPSPVSALDDDRSRRQRQLSYKRWVWWTRFSTIIIVVQFLLAMYLVYGLARKASQDGTSNYCGVGSISNNKWWNQHLLIIFLTVASFIAIFQCFSSSDVLRWRSFYDVQDNAWKAHYQEVFDHGIREALCCLGRFKYWETMEEDEVYSVAQLLGDLVTYRASGTGHLELLAGLALLQSHNQSPKVDECCADAPLDKIQEATTFHPFAEAAYTGPLLDVGRNPLLFPCAWLYRQGVFTSWSRNRRPKLEGDNWWRGHAAAFLRYANLPPESLRRGRVNQAKCQASYFVVVLHHLSSLVIAVRGTETPEDLIIDGLCRETSLTIEDLDGIINDPTIGASMREHVLSSFPHYGHSGIIDAARELYNQIEGNNSRDCENGVAGSETGGFLSSLMGTGCECEGYAIRIVGHSLGGAIATLLGIRLHGRFSDLHVYAYGPLPCVDLVIADACSGFITSIVHHSEFSSYLSINSILRLRAAALTTMSQSNSTDSALISKLAHLFLYLSKYQNGKMMRPLSNAMVRSEEETYNRSQYETSEGPIQSDEYSFLHDKDRTKESGRTSMSSEFIDDFINPFASNEDSVEDPVSEFLERVPSSVRESSDDPSEVFLPGVIIHLIKVHRGLNLPILKGWGVQAKEPPYRAILANRDDFKDIIISPSMFLDHLPWRCQYALQKVLEYWNVERSHEGLQVV
ncbi:uncharacterized protein LOC141656661 [Silene latifolia]|uniref:uncharacterized protein LOC141656661 n=1 Tax=Silene latifolia TaxID=37657 RepID=UPI003D76E99A